MMKKKSLVALLPLLLLLPMCSGGSDDTKNASDSPLGPSGTRQASVRIYLTDKPAEAFTAVNVTISAVRLHQSADAAEGVAGWIEFPATAAMPQDLLVLRDGGLLALCDPTPIPVGNYQQVRLVLVPNTGSEPPFSNSVVTASGEHPIEVPSGSIKIVHPFAVVEGQTTDLTLDFDASLSVKQRGNGAYFMQPVIRASSNTTPTATAD